MLRILVSNRRNTALGCRAHGKTILCGDLLQKAAGSSEVGERLSVLLTFPVTAIFSKAATIVKRQTLMMKTNPMMYCSFYGVREVSVSQNKQDVKISTLETTVYMLRSPAPSRACMDKGSSSPQPYQEHQ